MLEIDLSTQGNKLLTIDDIKVYKLHRRKDKSFSLVPKSLSFLLDLFHRSKLNYFPNAQLILQRLVRNQMPK